MNQTIEIRCPQCDARLTARGDQLGETITCRDCLEEFVVQLGSAAPGNSVADPPHDTAQDEVLQRLLHPEFSEVAPPHVDDDGPLRLDEAAVEAPVKKRRILERDYEFGFNCPLCGTRMHLTDKQVGAEVKCPDCHSLVQVREPHPGKRRAIAGAAPPKDDADEFRLEGLADDFRLSEVDTDRNSPSVYHSIAEDLMKAAEAELPHTDAPRKRSDNLGVQESLDRAEAEVEEQQRRERPPLPPSPFTSKIAAYLFDMQAIGRLVALGAALWILLAAVQAAILYSGGTGLQQFLSVMLRMFAITFGLVVVTATAVSMQSILEDTSNGLDEIESWPDVNILEWILDAFYIFNSLFIAAVPGLVLAQTTRWGSSSDIVSATVAALGVGAGLVFIFPFVLISMLEAGSAILPYSQPVVRGLILASGRWLQFFALAAAVVVAGLILVFVRVHFAESLPLPVCLLIAVAFVLLSSFYFRLLGRLTWCCQEAVAEADELLEDDESR